MQPLIPTRNNPHESVSSNFFHCVQDRCFQSVTPKQFFIINSAPKRRRQRKQVCVDKKS